MPTDSEWRGYTNPSGSIPSWALAVYIEQQQDTLPAVDLKTFSQFGSWGLVTALLLAIIVAVVRGYWVPGSYYQAMKAERDAAREDASDATKTLERLTAGWKPPQ